MVPFQIGIGFVLACRESNKWNGTILVVSSAGQQACQVSHMRVIWIFFLRWSNGMEIDGTCTCWMDIDCVVADRALPSGTGHRQGQGQRSVSISLCISTMEYP